MIVLNNRSKNDYKSDNVIEDLLYQNYVDDPRMYMYGAHEHDVKLKNIERAVEVFKNVASKPNCTIGIVVDSDVDGYTSAGLLCRGINQYNPDINIKCYLHEEKTHGLNNDIGLWNELDQLSMVIVPDAGSENVNEARMLYDHGISVIVLDHHTDIIESDYSVIVNNQLNNYPNKALSGVGVTYKFLKELGVDVSEWMDLVALGLVADLMDIRDIENKFLINRGLNNIKTPIIKALIKNYHTIKGLGFSVAPYINATIRVGSIQVRQLLFKSIAGYTTAVEDDLLLESMKECKRIQSELVEKLKEINIITHKENIVISEDPYCMEKAKNVYGLLASQIMERVKVPVCVVGNYNNVYSGSCRSPVSIKDLINNSGLAVAKGHNKSFGITIDDRKTFNDLNALLNGETDRLNRDVTTVNYIIDQNDINASLVKKLAKFNKYVGKGILPCSILLKDLDIYAKALKNDTITFDINGVKCIKFKTPEDMRNIMNTNKIDIVVVPEINTYNGVEYPQLGILKYEINER